MASEHGSLEQHKKYLATVPPEVLLQRLRVFRLDPAVMSVPSLICISDIIQAPFAKYRQWVHPLEPRTLDDLKNWFGVPNEIAKRMSSEACTLSVGGELGCGLAHELPRALPMMHRYDFQSLDHKQKAAVQQTAEALLYGYVDPE